jgi:hypothetical protein
MTMSDFGLYASIYEQLRAYADKLDYALINLRSKDNNIVSKARKELASLLRHSSVANTTQPTGTLIAMVLSHELNCDTEDLSRLFISLADSFEKKRYSEDDIAKLETIATAIDKECARTGKRMRGMV